VLETLEGIQSTFNGTKLLFPSRQRRIDASQEQTDVESFAVLEPIADGFRNYLKGKYTVSAETLLVDKAQLLTLTGVVIAAFFLRTFNSGPS
jgi:catalase-peroxidase